MKTQKGYQLASNQIYPLILYSMVIKQPKNHNLALHLDFLQEEDI